MKRAVLSLAVLSTLFLSACGGGGGTDVTGSTGATAGSTATDGSATGSPDGSSTAVLYGSGTATTTSPATLSFEMTLPDATRTGLNFSSPKALADDADTLREVAAKLQVAFEAGPAMAATQAMGKATPNYGGVPCVTGTSGQYTTHPSYYLTHCLVEGYDLTAATLSVAGTLGGSYQVSTASLAVGAGPGIAAATSLSNVSADCERVEGVSRCKVIYKGSDNIDYQFGWDSTVSILDRNVAINGTHGCGCDGTWLVTYMDFTGLSGRALVLGQGGQKAEFVRRDAQVFDIIWTDGTLTRRYRLANGTLTAAA